MEIGILITNDREYDEAFYWDFDYIEGFPGMLGPDENDPRAEAKALKRIAQHTLPMKSLCGFIPDPQGRGLLVVGPDVCLDRLRLFVTRIFDRMQRAGIEVIGYGSGSSRWVPDGFNPDVARQQVADFMHLCADIGEPRGVEVALEPAFPVVQRELAVAQPDALLRVASVALLPMAAPKLYTMGHALP